jgi:ribonuclease HI
LALIKGLQFFYKYFVDNNFEKNNLILKVYSDSQLVIKTINDNWKRKKNLDLWFQLDEILMKFKKYQINLSFNWILGHAGNKYNEIVDVLAKKAALKCKNIATPKKPLTLF